ncbi:hypothetical protein LNQ81_08375 [Myroides sp. M-43]|uniref:hypothetical protein n=1 Tax=Myroides oncorhynchi TaxID=2893756 RepID=UPI001E41FD2F|nr:hypothetical protein [Myroides oncorhynchi]MCC9042705.1 hypothetical protein [Myroides oncorhynchi]
MTILTNDDYIACLKKHIEAVKHAPKYTLLIPPSPAQIRDYCLRLCQGNTLSKDDLQVLNTFFKSHATDLDGLKTVIQNVDIDKCKPIQNFLNGKTTTTKNHAVIEMMAVMYDYELRPYNKFRKSGLDIDDDSLVEEPIAPAPPIVEENKETVEEKTIVEDTPPLQSFTEPQTPITTPEKKKSKNKLLAIVASIVLMIGGGVVISNTLSTDKCMKWEDDKYVAYDCGEATIQSFAGTNSEPVPYDKSVLENFKQITVDCNTVFFKKNKPQVWFVKTGDNQHEYFSSPGTGVHPTLGKPLKPITQYHLNKYIYPSCK